MHIEAKNPRKTDVFHVCDRLFPWVVCQGDGQAEGSPSLEELATHLITNAVLMGTKHTGNKARRP
ncbi:hypothetical protein SCLCIDRAFT_1217973 [Scleroderma citrinum Foug A]|uniref:Uncharacterized protein n=1 Tax=Scleroderma citrinum Foug A TaxID=1036808 RepID=A0A0C3DSL1_9AGAM|nr:hypothetical protein SCLCIDRAFT_1217973 [Scleroderma citrinum Foug A]